MKGKKQKDDKRQTSEHRKPVKLPLKFDEAIRRALKVRPPEAGWEPVNPPKERERRKPDDG